MAIGVLTCLLISLFVAIYAFANDEISPFSLAVHNPLMVLGLTALWAFPLLACFWKPASAESESSSWLFLDSGSPPHSSSILYRRQLITPLITGIVGGVLGWGLVLLIRGLGLDTVVNLFAVSMIIQGLTGAIAAAVPKRLASILGLFAAATAGFVLVIGYGLLSPYLPPSAIAFVSIGMINSGGLFAIPVVIAIATISSAVRRILR